MTRDVDFFPLINIAKEHGKKTIIIGDRTRVQCSFKEFSRYYNNPKDTLTNQNHNLNTI